MPTSYDWDRNTDKDQHSSSQKLASGIGEIIMRIHVIGNCQARQFGHFLQHATKGIEILAHPLDTPDSRSDNAVRIIRDKMKSSDLFLCQPSNINLLSDTDLKRDFGDQVFVVPRVYFNGTLPDACYVGKFGTRVSGNGDYHSALVITAYLNGLSANDTYSLFNAKDFERLGLFEHWNTSLNEMRDRETNCDVKVSQLINLAAKEYECLYSHNHPTMQFSIEIVRKFCDKFNIKLIDIDMVKIFDPLYYEPWCPVFNFVAEYFGLKYRSAEIYKSNTRAVFGLRQFIENCYESYSKHRREDLVINSPGFTIKTASKMQF